VLHNCTSRSEFHSKRSHSKKSDRTRQSFKIWERAAGSLCGTGHRSHGTIGGGHGPNPGPICRVGGGDCQLLLGRVCGHVEGHEAVHGAAHRERHGGAVQEPVGNAPLQVDGGAVGDLGGERRRRRRWWLEEGGEALLF